MAKIIRRDWTSKGLLGKRARHPTYERDWRRKKPKKVQGYRTHNQGASP